MDKLLLGQRLIREKKISYKSDEARHACKHSNFYGDVE